MRAASGWTSRSDYSRFLVLQYTARHSVETWLTRHAPPDLCPPEQCGLIARDLARLGSPLPLPDHWTHFDLPTGQDAEKLALGVAWVLAGSSLGNRSILKELQRIASATTDPHSEPWPHAFLGDEGMLAFWKHLRVRIERPADLADVEAAAHAATAVFDHFLAVTDAAGERP